MSIDHLFHIPNTEGTGERTVKVVSVNDCGKADCDHAVCVEVNEVDTEGRFLDGPLHVEASELVRWDLRLLIGRAAWRWPVTGVAALETLVAADRLRASARYPRAALETLNAAAQSLAAALPSGVERSLVEAIYEINALASVPAGTLPESVDPIDPPHPDDGEEDPVPAPE